MKTTFATYEHSRVGFPGVVLKWSETRGRVDPARVVIKGIISGVWNWHNPAPMPFIESELERFDEYVGRAFGNDASVQG